MEEDRQPSLGYALECGDGSSLGSLALDAVEVLETNRLKVRFHGEGGDSAFGKCVLVVTVADRSRNTGRAEAFVDFGPGGQ